MAKIGTRMRTWVQDVQAPCVGSGLSGVQYAIAVLCKLVVRINRLELIAPFMKPLQSKGLQGPRRGKGKGKG